jgi:quinol monooxygenase YgiN
MRLILQLVLAMVILPATLWSPAYAQDNAVYLVTYIEVMPNAVASGAALLERYSDASRKEIGNLSFDVLHEMARPERLAILEVWKDKAALDGHDKAASTLHFRDRLNEIQGAPYDERILSGLYLGPVKDDKPGAIYVLTHVDVVPQHLNDGLALLRAMSVDTAKDNGNISYEVLQQANRLNHFTVVEEWTSKQTLDAHAMSPHTRAFRERLLPLAGALYDERFYKKLD